MTPIDDVRHKRRMVEQLRRSRVFRDYEKAFRECTGLPLNLHGGECFALAQQGDAHGNPFCTLLAACNHTCAACLAFQQDLTQAVGLEPGTRECFAGLSESAVPVRAGGQIVAYLQTGQLLLQPPTPAQLRTLEQRLRALGIDGEHDRLAAAYARTRVVPRPQYEAILRLLAIFARQLGEISSQLAVQEEEAEPPAIAHARAYITEHHTDELTLEEVARAVNMSRYHFCKSFHRVTQQTFTDFLAGVRVEHVRQCLLDPETRISDAAYAAGFQSLSQFSRVFRRIAGVSPSVYRERLDRARSA